MNISRASNALILLFQETLFYHQTVLARTPISIIQRGRVARSTRVQVNIRVFPPTPLLELIQAAAIPADVFTPSRTIHGISCPLGLRMLKELNMRRRPDPFFAGTCGRAVISVPAALLFCCPADVGREFPSASLAIFRLKLTGSGGYWLVVDWQLTLGSRLREGRLEASRVAGRTGRLTMLDAAERL